MRADVQVQLAQFEDVPDLASLRGGGDRLEQTMHGYLTGSYSPSFAMETRRVLVARVDGKFAGYISGHRTTRYDCQGELQWLNVAEEFRGRGVADELIRHFFDWFAKEAMFRVCVDVSPENEVARRFYFRHGAVELNPHFLVWADIRGFTVKPLDMSTWPDFAALVERHNGVWGGCWCIGFHQKPGNNRAEKELRVREGRAHAALVYDGDRAVGWCQFGPTDELPRIKHKRQYLVDLIALPDWRITCFFVDKEYRGKGVASVALAGALEQIAQLGGGTVESYPEDTEGRKTSGAFLYNSSLSIFERQGFVRSRRLGMRHWVVAKVVEPRETLTKSNDPVRVCGTLDFK